MEFKILCELDWESAVGDVISLHITKDVATAPTELGEMVGGNAAVYDGRMGSTEKFDVEAVEDDPLSVWLVNADKRALITQMQKLKVNDAISYKEHVTYYGSTYIIKLVGR